MKLAKVLIVMNGEGQPLIYTTDPHLGLPHRAYTIALIV